MIEDLDPIPEVTRPRVARPRVSSETIGWAFLSALGAGFIAKGVAEIAFAVVWPVLLPPSQPRPEWLTAFAVSRAAQLVAIGAVALRAGGVRALALCVGYEGALLLAQLPNLTAICERLGPQPDPSIPCGFPTIAVSTWPTWIGLAVGVVGSRWLLPSPIPGANTLLRAAGAFTFALAVAADALALGQGNLFNGLAAVGWVDRALGSRGVPYLVAVSTIALFVNLAAGFLAGSLLRRARAAGVLLLALLIGYEVTLGVTQIRNNVEIGVPHPLELAYLQSTSVLRPAVGILGIALGRMLVRAKSARPRPA